MPNTTPTSRGLHGPVTRPTANTPIPWPDQQHRAEDSTLDHGQIAWARVYSLPLTVGHHESQAQFFNYEPEIIWKATARIVWANMSQSFRSHKKVSKRQVSFSLLSRLPQKPTSPPPPPLLSSYTSPTLTYSSPSLPGTLSGARPLPQHTGPKHRRGCQAERARSPAEACSPFRCPQQGAQPAAHAPGAPVPSALLFGATWHRRTLLLHSGRWPLTHLRTKCFC